MTGRAHRSREAGSPDHTRQAACGRHVTGMRGPANMPRSMNLYDATLSRLRPNPPA